MINLIEFAKKYEKEILTTVGFASIGLGYSVFMRNNQIVSKKGSWITIGKDRKSFKDACQLSQDLKDIGNLRHVWEHSESTHMIVENVNASDLGTLGEKLSKYANKDINMYIACRK